MVLFLQQSHPPRQAIANISLDITDLALDIESMSGRAFKFENFTYVAKEIF